MKYFIALFAILAGLVSLAAADPCIRDDDTPIGFAALGNTTGGAGGPTTRVSTLADLKSAVSGSSPKIVILTSSLTGNEVVTLGENTSLYGVTGVVLTGIGIRIINTQNVIVRNLIIEKVLATAGDAIAVQNSHSVWVDHVDLSSDQDHGKDYYDGLFDVTHGSYFVTLSWSHLHDHFKACLFGHVDTNGAQDSAISVTLHHNYFQKANSRTPSIRFGRVHDFNCFYKDVSFGLDTRDGAQVLVENTVFVNTGSPVFSDFSVSPGFAVLHGNDLGGAQATAQTGNFTQAPYDYTLDSLDTVRTQVFSEAGATLNIS